MPLTRAPYFDFGFLVSFILPREQSEEAVAIAEQFDLGYPVNRLHVLQLENLLLRSELMEKDVTSRTVIARARRLWQRYRAEGVFELVDVDYAAALSLAMELNRRHASRLAHPAKILHASLAKVSAASHFLSFDADARFFAHRLGLRLLP